MPCLLRPHHHTYIHLVHVHRFPCKSFPFVVGPLKTSNVIISSYPQAPGVQLASVKSEEYATDLSVVNWERESDTLSGTGELGRGAEFVGQVFLHPCTPHKLIFLSPSTPSTELDEEPTNEPLQPQQYPASGALPWPLYNHSSHLWLST